MLPNDNHNIWNLLTASDEETQCLPSSHKMEADILKSALVDAIIPDDTVTEISEMLQAAAELQPEPPRLLAVKERDLLFFGASMLRT